MEVEFTKTPEARGSARIYSRRDITALTIRETGIFIETEDYGSQSIPYEDLRRLRITAQDGTIILKVSQ